MPSLTLADLSSRSRPVADDKPKRTNWVLKSKPGREAKSEAKGEDSTRNAARELRKRRSPLYDRKD